jgi:putative flippase GtrA
MQQDLVKGVPPPERQRMAEHVRQIAGEAGRFVGYGLISYAFGVGLSSLFGEVIGLHEEISVGLTLVILFIVNFGLARRFVFRASGHKGKQFVRFVSTSLAMRGAEYLIFLTLVRVAHAHYLVALTLAMGFSGCAKFLLYRTVVFGRSLSRAQRTPAG